MVSVAADHAPVEVVSLGRHSLVFFMHGTRQLRPFHPVCVLS